MKVTNIKFSNLKKLNYTGITEKNKELKNLTTFRVGGRAKLYLEINTLECFIKVMTYLKNSNLNIFVLGNGSNVLVSSLGFDGIVIKLKGDFSRISIRGELLEIGAGVMLSQIINFTKNKNLSGFEYGIGIPGTIGGATCMNASAYDFEMSKIIKYVVAYDYDKIIYLKNEDCKFGYRDSIFQHGKYIILRVGVELKKSSRHEIENIIKEVCEKRNISQPLGTYNAGSVFKKKDNICVSKLLDEMGVKGLCVNGAVVSNKHANFIINKGNASSEDVINLIQKIKNMFFEKYKINLELEIKLIGEFNEIDR